MEDNTKLIIAREVEIPKNDKIEPSKMDYYWNKKTGRKTFLPSLPDGIRVAKDHSMHEKDLVFETNPQIDMAKLATEYKKLQSSHKDKPQVWKQRFLDQYVKQIATENYTQFLAKLDLFQEQNKGPKVSYSDYIRELKDFEAYKLEHPKPVIPGLLKEEEDQAQNKWMHQIYQAYELKNNTTIKEKISPGPNIENLIAEYNRLLMSNEIDKQQKEYLANKCKEFISNHAPNLYPIGEDGLIW